MSTNPENERKKGAARPWRTALFVLLGLVAAAVLAAVLFFAAINKTGLGRVEIVDRPDTTSSLTAESAPTADPEASEAPTELDYYESGEIQQVPIYAQEQINRFIYSVLLVVQNDSLAAESPQTDMMFILSFNALKQKLTVVALMRDMVVPVEGYGWKRLNTAYSYGGIGLLINTVNETFELDIQNYIYTGADELALLADQLGGIDATLTQAEAAYINGVCGGSLTEGEQLLSGAEAIAHLKDRTTGGTGDFGRSARQLRVIESFVWQLRATVAENKALLITVFASVLQNIRTNVDLEMLKGLGYEMLKTDTLRFSGVRVPFDDSYETTILSGATAYTLELEKNRILLEQALYGKE